MQIKALLEVRSHFLYILMCVSVGVCFYRGCREGGISPNIIFASSDWPSIRIRCTFRWHPFCHLFCRMDDRPGMSFKQCRVCVYVCNRPAECLCVKDVSRVDSWWTPAWRRCESELMQCHSHLDLTRACGLSLLLAPTATVSSLSQSGTNPPAISLSLTLFIPTLARPKPFTQDQVAGVKGALREKERDAERFISKSAWWGCQPWVKRSHRGDRRCHFPASPPFVPPAAVLSTLFRDTTGSVRITCEQWALKWCV